MGRQRLLVRLAKSEDTQLGHETCLLLQAGRPMTMNN